MKRILGFAAIAIMASTVNATASNQAVDDNDSHATGVHQVHHKDAEQTTQHQQAHKKELTAAHTHDHGDDASKASKHTQEHNGSEEAAHAHDHKDASDAHAHEHDHGDMN